MWFGTGVLDVADPPEPLWEGYEQPPLMIQEEMRAKWIDRRTCVVPDVSKEGSSLYVINEDALVPFAASMAKVNADDKLASIG